MKNICIVTTWCMQFLRSYRVHKATWPWASFKVKKEHTNVNIELVQDVDVENIPITLQHHTSNTRGVIIFTKQFDFEVVWKLKKVTQRSTSNSSEMLMWRTLLKSYNLIHAIYENWMGSQGPSGCQMPTHPGNNTPPA